MEDQVSFVSGIWEKERGNNPHPSARQIFFSYLYSTDRINMHSFILCWSLCIYIKLYVICYILYVICYMYILPYCQLLQIFVIRILFFKNIFLIDWCIQIFLSWQRITKVYYVHSNNNTKNVCGKVTIFTQKL